MSKLSSGNLNQKKVLLYFWILFVILPVFLFFIVMLGAKTGTLGFDPLPSLQELENPKSNLASEIISGDGKVFGKYFKHEAPIERNRSDQEWKDDLKKSIIVLSKSGSRVIGVVKGVQSPNVEEVGVWRINSVYLNENFRRKETGGDIAEKMLEMVLVEIKNRGAAKVRLWVLSKRSSAIGLYEKSGFKKINPVKALPIMGFNPKYLSEWQIMELDLTESQK